MEVTNKQKFQWVQQVTGTTDTTFMKPDRPIPYITNEGWINTLRDFLHKSQLQLYIPQLQGVQIQ